MKRWKRMIDLTVAVVMAAVMPMTSFGAVLSDFDADTQARLQDNVLEYEELQGLIAVYNPALRIQDDKYLEGIQDLEMMIDELSTNVGELNRIADDMKESGNTMGYLLYSGTANGIRDEMLGGYRDSLKSIKSKTATKGLRMMEYQLTAGAQTLMIYYQTAVSQREIAAKAKELSEAAYQSALTQRSLNMATDADVLSAKNSLEQAENGLVQADAGLMKLRQSLCMMTGWEFDASPEIRPIPPVGEERLAVMNLETDKEKAIGNNLDLAGQRMTADQARSLSAKEKERRRRSMSENEQKVRIQIEQLYHAVQEKKAEADGAAAAYAGAVMKKQGADYKLQSGAMSPLEYLKAEMDFLSQKAAKEAADMALLQAVNDYDWGVKGLAKLE